VEPIHSHPAGIAARNPQCSRIEDIFEKIHSQRFICPKQRRLASGRDHRQSQQPQISGITSLAALVAD
jgi:hypothetical protein